MSSVFGRFGAVIAQSGDYRTDQVTEGTNLYFTDTRAQSALSGSLASINSNIATATGNIATITGQLVTINSNIATATGNIANLQMNLATATGDILSLSGRLSTLSGSVSTLFTNLATTNANLATATGNIATLSGQIAVLQGSSHAPVTLSSPNGLSLSGQQLSLGLASVSTTGSLSVADWNTFNSKINLTSLSTTGSYLSYNNITGVFGFTGTTTNFTE